jgi:hypothetical protein
MAGWCELDIEPSGSIKEREISLSRRTLLHEVSFYLVLSELFINFVNSTDHYCEMQALF